MNFIDMIKEVTGKLLPKPVMPQKRYIVIFLTIVYFGARLYVQSTPSPEDDMILDQLHSMAFKALAENNSNLNENADEKREDEDKSLVVSDESYGEQN